jgi:hypothetical protein
LQELDLGGEIESIVLLDEAQVMAIVRPDSDDSSQSVNQIVSVQLRTGSVESIPGFEGLDSLTTVGKHVLVLSSTDQGKGVFRLPSASGVATTQSEDLPAPELDGLAINSTLHAIGSNHIVVFEPLSGGTRLSSFEKTSAGWQLFAERTFESNQVRFANALTDSSIFAIESEHGISILNNTSGLPTIEVLEQASGPTTFDASRGLLLTRSREDATQVLGWSQWDWNLVLSISLPEALSGETIPDDWSLGYLNDTFVAVFDGAIYRHSLTASDGTTVQISDGSLEQIAIGVRSRGWNRAPSLRELPDFATDEDVPLPLPNEAISRSGSDADGDTLYYFVRSPGTQGRLQWSSTAFAVFNPTPNANGQDRLGIQAFDGLQWSEMQSLRIDVLPVNDPPEGFSGQNEYRIPEQEPGAVLGRFGVVDSDREDVYRYVVTDGRFVVSDGVLALSQNVALDFEASSTIVLSVLAFEIRNGDTVRSQVTVHVQDRNDPPQGIILTGNGSIPEKVAPYVVGNISVIDPDRSEVYDISVSDPRFEVVGNTVRVKSGSGVTYEEPGWIELTFVAVSRSSGDTVRRTERLHVIKDDTPYHNDANPMDVDGDGYVTPLDPLIIINYINFHGSGPIGPGEGEAGGDLDVDGDGRISPLDILIVINTLNSQRPQGGGKDGPANSGGGQAPSGEGEGNGDVPPLQAGFYEEDLPGRRNRSQNGIPTRFR